MTSMPIFQVYNSRFGKTLICDMECPGSEFPCYENIVLMISMRLARTSKSFYVEVVEGLHFTAVYRRLHLTVRLKFLLVVRQSSTATCLGYATSAEGAS